MIGLDSPSSFLFDVSLWDRGCCYQSRNGYYHLVKVEHHRDSVPKATWVFVIYEKMGAREIYEASWFFFCVILASDIVSH